MVFKYTISLNAYFVMSIKLRSIRHKYIYTLAQKFSNMKLVNCHSLKIL